MDATETEKRIYSKVGGWLCLDFTNTMQSYKLHNPDYDYLRSYEDLTLWARQGEIISAEDEQALNHRASQMPEQANETLEMARALRDVINGIFSAIATGHTPQSEALDALNRELSAAMSHSRIEHIDDGYAWGWDSFPAEMGSIFWPVIRSAADLLTRRDKLELVRECAGDTCGWLFVDTSKNHSRRWCDMRDCGNAAKAKRHYHRKVKATAGPHTHTHGD